jgi:hypothetical protein
MAINFKNITLEIAKKAVQAYNSGCYGRFKNPELDDLARALFCGGLATSKEGILEQVRFIGIDYGGVAGSTTARSLVSAIADDIFKARDRYASLVEGAPPILNGRIPKGTIEELYAPFIKELPGKRNWLVWATKFWHFLNSEAFPIFDSRVAKFFIIPDRLQGVDKYVYFCDRFRDFALSHRVWLPALREVDGGLACATTSCGTRCVTGSRILILAKLAKAACSQRRCALPLMLSVRLLGRTLRELTTVTLGIWFG